MFTPRQMLATGLAAAALLASSGSLKAQECYADCDGNGELNFFDFLCFQNLFVSGSPEADCDGSGELDFFDFLCFQSEFAAGCPGPDFITAELASIRLSGYPHVAYVQAFSAGQTVMIALDPTAQEIIGEADVYIVAAKSAAQWSADPSLLDVRPSGIQTIDFPGGSSVLDNTFELTGSGALESDAGERLGVGYDLVIDVNRNGVLDAGDLIDGAGEPGFTKFKDLTTAGPAATARVESYSATFPGIPASRNQQRLTYPADIATRTDVPVIIISHGNGQDYRWYDYLHDLFATHGWAVMSHQNDTMPGIEAASETQSRHTDFFFGNLDTIAGGALAGRIDKSRTVWIGHGRGGESVARAINKIATGAYTPINYTLDDIVLGSSIAPTDFLGTSRTSHDVYAHVIAGSADGDVSGSPANPITQYWAIYERASGRRVSTYIHGADHNSFSCCGFDDCTFGSVPYCLSREETQQVAKVVWHALIQDAVHGNPAALEFVQRQQKSLRPLGVKPSTIVNHEYKHAEDKFVIDDFQSNPSTALSSSGGEVTFDVGNLIEDRLDDADLEFTWTPADPMNGMTRASRETDTTRGIVFDYQDDRFLEFEVVEPGRDFTSYSFLSWRACQGTRHPDTTFFLGDQVYEVTLRDSSGATSTIRIDAYGGGHQEPFQRTGAGIGAGWGNEFETIRINTRDFARDGGSGIDLTDIVAVRFEFGPSHGTPRGRIGFDDLELTR